MTTMPPFASCEESGERLNRVGWDEPAWYKDEFGQAKSKESLCVESIGIAYRFVECFWHNTPPATPIVYAGLCLYETRPFYRLFPPLASEDASGGRQELSFPADA
jgi:hypothetical protein